MLLKFKSLKTNPLTKPGDPKTHRDEQAFDQFTKKN